MKTLQELTGAQRAALATVDRHHVLFRHNRGWSSVGSKVIQPQTMKVLVAGGICRVAEKKTKNGFILVKATLTDWGETLVEQMKARQERRAA